MTKRDSDEKLAVFMSFIVSMSIGAMLFFYTNDGNAFVAWGVFFGIMITSYNTESDKLLLGALYFLNPNNAIFIYNSIKMEEEKNELNATLAKFENDVEETKNMAYHEAKILQKELQLIVLNTQIIKGKDRLQHLIDLLNNANSTLLTLLLHVSLNIFIALSVPKFHL